MKKCIALEQAQALGPPKKLSDSVGLLRRVKIKVQPKELVDECLDCQPLPLSQDLKVQHLLTLIGGRLDHGVVSVTKPTDFSTSKLQKHYSKERRTFIKEFVVQNTKIMPRFGQLTIKQETFLVNWLQEQSNCPLKLEWRDMGPFSWPRYVKVLYALSYRGNFSSVEFKLAQRR
ncbi:hypothetical protein QZH41_000780 [Actinostola sp. cb2023]|nr:hypothetical protein QZH41_000780 [Actinostola sp. cb2023]